MTQEQLDNMTKKQALEYLGLDSDANDFAIDEKFWQLSKRYRGSKDPDSEEKLSELSAVYNIATGKRDEDARKKEVREQSSKLLGKTGAEWKNYFAYSWFKILVIIVVALVGCSIIYNVIFKGRNDLSVVCFGHFSVDSGLMEERMTSDDIKSPYVSAIDVVVPNDQGQTRNAYADQSLSAVLSTYPNVLITDSMTYEYYFGNYMDLTELYRNLKLILSEERLAALEPVYLNERDAYVATKDQVEDDSTESRDISSMSTEPVLVGIRINDKAAMDYLGITDLWPDTDPGIILSIYSGTTDYSKAENAVMRLCQVIPLSN